MAKIDYDQGFEQIYTKKQQKIKTPSDTGRIAISRIRRDLSRKSRMDIVSAIKDIVTPEEMRYCDARFMRDKEWAFSLSTPQITKSMFNRYYLNGNKRSSAELFNKDILDIYEGTELGKRFETSVGSVALYGYSEENPTKVKYIAVRPMHGSVYNRLESEKINVMDDLIPDEEVSLRAAIPILAEPHATLIVTHSNEGAKLLQATLQHDDLIGMPLTILPPKIVGINV